jgi:hypothetical protein
MLGGWIKHLARCDWKDRGRHTARISKKTRDSTD